jgi:hypothetical protein
MGDFEGIIVPSSEADYVELAGSTRTATGKLFRKHILTQGTLIHPLTKRRIKVDDAFFDRLVKNFEDGVCPIVQIPKAGAKNEHTEAVDANIGEAVRLERDGNKLYAVLDVRQDADKVGKTILGASAMMHLDYEDTRTGKRAGPTLLHVCATNRPYVVDLEPYEELAALSAEESGETVVLTPAPAETSNEENEIMDLDELLALLKSDHGIDVADLMASAAAAESASDEAAELTNRLGGALQDAGLLQLTNGASVSADDIVGAITELGEQRTELSNRLGVLETERAEASIDKLVEDGFVLPTQRDTMVKLSMEQPELFKALVPAAPIVALSRENGVIPEETGPDETLESEIARYTEQAANAGYVKR